LLRASSKARLESLGLLASHLNSSILAGEMRLLSKPRASATLSANSYLLILSPTAWKMPTMRAGRLRRRV